MRVAIALFVSILLGTFLLIATAVSLLRIGICY